jgi:hypothetical protein
MQGQGLLRRLAMNRDETLALAQREANRAGKHLLVLNLNPFGSMWVVREYKNQLAKERGVWIVSPKAT